MLVETRQQAHEEVVSDDDTSSVGDVLVGEVELIDSAGEVVKVVNFRQTINFELQNFKLIIEV